MKYACIEHFSKGYDFTPPPQDTKDYYEPDKHIKDNQGHELMEQKLVVMKEYAAKRGKQLVIDDSVDPENIDSEFIAELDTEIKEMIEESVANENAQITAYEKEQAYQKQLSFGSSDISNRPQQEVTKKSADQKQVAQKYDFGAFFELPTRSQPVQVFNSNPQVLNDNVNPRLPVQCRPRHPEETIKLGSLAEKELAIPKYNHRPHESYEPSGGFWLFNRPNNTNIKWAVVLLLTLSVITVLMILFWVFMERLVK
jgi:hypothetical protein